MFLQIARLSRSRNWRGSVRPAPERAAHRLDHPQVIACAAFETMTGHVADADLDPPRF